MLKFVNIRFNLQVLYSEIISRRPKLSYVMDTSQVSLQVSVLAENFAANWTGGPSLVGVQVPLEGDLLAKLPRADFARE
jgi:hypothetical protein